MIGGDGSYATGGYWTRTKPESFKEVFGGTAVMPEWNGCNKIVEYKVQPGEKLFVWEGPTASKPVVGENSSMYQFYKTKYHLEGGADQIYMPQKYRDYTNSDILSRFTEMENNATITSWTN